MISQIIHVKVQPGKAAELEGLVAQLMRDVRANEPGSFLDVRRVRGKPYTYLYYLSFTDKAAFDRYTRADYHLGMAPKALALLDGDAEWEELDEFV